MASEPNGAGLTDAAIADLTDAELVGRSRSLVDEVMRQGLSHVVESPQAMRPALVQMLADMQSFPFSGTYVQTLQRENWLIQVEIVRRLGEMLRGARLALGLSFRDVARVAGIHSKFVDEIEQGRRGWSGNPALFERACTEGGLDRADCTQSLALWFPIPESGLCRTIREVAVDPAWLSGGDGAVATLLRTIREGRSFDLLPILGDALEEAGCAEAEILAHCRNPGLHGRGCWVVDALVRAGRPGRSPRDP